MYSRFEEVCARCSQELSRFSSGALEIHPDGDPNRWNARQIVEHLMLTYRSTGSVLHGQLEKGRPTKARPMAKQRVSQFVLFGLGLMPNGRPAPVSVRPGQTPDRLLDSAALADLFQSELLTMDELLARCEERFGKQPMATHQILGPLSANQWRRFHVVHARHHLKQLHEIRLNELSKKIKVPV